MKLTPECLEKVPEATKSLELWYILPPDDSYISSWTLANGTINTDLYHSDRLYLAEKGNLELTESIFLLKEVSNDIISSNHNKFSKSHKIVASFKLNNTDFPSLPFPSVSKSA